MYLIVQGISTNYLHLIRTNTLSTSVTFYSVAQLVVTQHYKPKSRMFNPGWGHWDFLIDLILPSALRSWGRLLNKEYLVSLLGGKGGRFGWLTTVPSACADCRNSRSLNLLEA
jgi:hypothetical protein